MANPIPVYMFSGFLESGKTTFIQGTLEDKRFNRGEKTLLLVCEEGEVEYEDDKFGSNVKVAVLDDKSEMNEDNLQKLADEIKAERVMVEYNGMWLIQEFYDNMPEGWQPVQNMLFIDSGTFLNYNANMRQLVFDKLSDCDGCVFNRMNPDDDIMAFHKEVRAVSRRADILYEYKDGTLKPDEIEDPLPFDVNAPVVEIADKDYALFYRDLVENLKEWKGRTIRFKGICALEKNFPDKTCVMGRHIMNCCAEDITYCGLVSKLTDGMEVVNSGWYTLTAKIDIRFSRLYGKKGPVFNVSSLEKAIEPEDPVATFY